MDKFLLGLYRVYWKDGGFSLAAVGMLENGDRWLAPVNWVHPTENQDVWEKVLRLEKIEVGPLCSKGPKKKIPFSCPACNGHGKVSRPPWVAGDVLTWEASTASSYPCQACFGSGIVWQVVEEDEDTGGVMSQHFQQKIKEENVICPQCNLPNDAQLTPLRSDGLCDHCAGRSSAKLWWAGKDVVGFLIRRGWRLNSEPAGMLHGESGNFIPEEDIINNGDTPEKGADALEAAALRIEVVG